MKTIVTGRFQALACNCGFSHAADMWPECPKCGKRLTLLTGTKEEVLGRIEEITGKPPDWKCSCGNAIEPDEQLGICSDCAAQILLNGFVR